MLPVGLRHLLLAAVAALLLSAPPAGAGTPPLVVGIADQKPEMFTDPLFTGLGLDHARIAVAWDVLHVGWQRRDLDAWMAAAKAAGVEPLVTFDHSRRPGRSRVLPRPAQLAHELRMLRRRYPFAREFAAWNEANYCGEKTCHRPQLVAGYYRALKLACPSCRILAAELLDVPGMAAWVRAFVRAARLQPAYWGLHNYLDANYLRTSGTRALLRVTTGQIWFTETGGIVRRRNHSHVRFTESAGHAAIATRWVFDRLVRLNPRRITRVYLFHWNPSTAHDSWDSGLVDVHDRARPAYRVLARVLRALRLRGQSPQSHAPAAG